MARLTRDDWADAALAALGAHGVEAVAVEPIAAGLGATKGSFYWHFGSRAELLSAALERWLDRDTDQVIAAVEARGGSAEERLGALFARVFDRDLNSGADLPLLSRLDDPEIADAVQRATERRIAYLAGLFRAAGLASAAARRRAVFAYAAYVGHLQLRAANPALVSRSVGSLRRYGDEVVAALLSS